jgi:hypothetical protein
MFRFRSIFRKKQAIGINSSSKIMKINLNENNFGDKSIITGSSWT